MLQVVGSGKTRLGTQPPQVHGAETSVERLVVVTAIPVEIERLERAELVGGRQFHVQHETAGSQHAIRLAQHPRDATPRHLVQKHRRKDEIETRIGEVECLGVHLHEAQRRAACLGAQRGIAQTGCRNVDTDHLGLRINLFPRRGVVAHRAAEIEDPPWPDVRMTPGDEAGNRLTDVIEIGAKEPEGGELETLLIDHAHGRIVAGVFLCITAGHEVDIDRAHRARHREARAQDRSMHTKATHRGLESRTPSVDGGLHHLIQQILRGDPQRRVEAK